MSATFKPDDLIPRLTPGRFVGVAATMLLAPLVGHWLAVQSWGTRLIYELSVMLLLPVCMAVPVTVLYVLFDRRVVRKSVWWLTLTVVCVAMFVVGDRIGWRIRRRAFEQLAGRSTSLVAAIVAYGGKNGVPPSDLDDLLPEFLPSVPSTQMNAYPTYKYLAGNAAKEWGGNPWVLYVDCGMGGLNFDRFVYLPLQNYPANGYGGSLERVGAWAYVHE
jgi:hypothetical protein